MPSSRPNLKRPHLELDEQSFQSLLSAAFTIQEHNDQLKKAQPAMAPAEAQREPEENSVCPHCGAVKPAAVSRCQNCSLEQFRPGERLQRNWASMWLMSQEQGLWPERSPEVDPPRAGEDTRKTVPPLAVERRPLAPLTRDSASNGLLAWPAAQELARETTAQAETKSETIRGRALDESVRDQSALGEPEEEGEWASATSAALTGEDLAPYDSDRTFEPLQLSESDDSFPIEASHEANSHRRFGDWRVKLRFHRADVYLGAAVVVAVLAVLWPAARAPQRAALAPWQRALVSLGLAEAPAPTVRLQGDPGIEVWVDPHTALFYCPGEEQYGKTADGHFSGQRDAQMDRFEPAGGSACQ
jgi:ribosomal protein L40E